MAISKKQIAFRIDHTNVKNTATRADIKTLCAEAKEYGFGFVCVSPWRVSDAKEFLEETDIKITAVVGFPWGFHKKEIKALEAKECVKDGADHVDMVINMGAFKDGDYEQVKQDIKAVKEAVVGVKPTAKVKVIIETFDLSKQEVKKVSALTKEAGADFVKTSTGYKEGGATIEDVKLIRETVGSDFGVKAAGGIRSLDDARAMIKAGADRIGTSTGVKIMEGEEVEKGEY